MTKDDDKEWKFQTYMGTNIDYDMLCELTCLDNEPPPQDLQAAGGTYFTDGGTFTNCGGRRRRRSRSLFRSHRGSGDGRGGSA